MKTVKIGKHNVELYDTIEELPITRFHKYQKYLLVDSGIGSTIEDFDKHIEKARRFLILNDPANAQKELENLQHLLTLILILFFIRQKLKKAKEVLKEYQSAPYI